MMCSIKPAVLLSILIICSSALSSERSGDFKAVVRDRSTDKSIQNATVEFCQTGQSGTSDSGGIVTIDEIKTGIYTITAFSSEYDTTTIHNIQIRSGKNDLVTIPLRKKIEELEAITVSANSTDLKKSNQTTSVTQLSNFELNNTAGSTDDINRVIGTLPSAVSGIGEGFDNNFYVRGGNSSENVFIVDGIELENSSHFSSIDQSGGAVGFLNPSLVDNLEFYAGGMPASMPSRLSSISDIHMRDGSFSDRKYQIDLNASGLGFTAEGPMAKGNASYLVNTRMVYLKFLESFLDELGGVPFYGDTYMKFAIKPGSSDKINLNLLYAFDNYKEESFRYVGHSDNMYPAPTDYYEKCFTYAGGVNWEHQLRGIAAKNNLSFSAVKVDRINEEIFTNGVPVTPAALNRRTTRAEPDTSYLRDYFYSDETLDRDENKKDHLSLKNDFSIFLRESDQLDLGVNGKVIRHQLLNKDSKLTNFAQITYRVDSTTVPGKKEYIILDTLDPFFHQIPPYEVDSSLTSTEVGAYAQYMWEQNRFRIIGGVRGDYYRLTRDFGISPRLGVAFNAGDAGLFSFSSGIYYQPHSELNDILFQYLVAPPQDSLPTLKMHEIELQRNMQVVLGYEKHFKWDNYLSAEIYYKYYDREYAYINPEWQDFVDTNLTTDQTLVFKDPEGEKRVYGLELMFKKKRYNRFYYSLAYSLFFAENRFTNGKWYRDENEMRNTFSGILGYNFPKYHGFALRISAMEGRPYNRYNIITDENGWITPELDTTQEYYSMRYDPMVSLSLRYSLNVPMSKGNFEFYIDLINILNLTPTVDRYFSWGKQSWEYETVNGFLPIGGITFDF